MYARTFDSNSGNVGSDHPQQAPSMNQIEPYYETKIEQVFTEPTVRQKPALLCVCNTEIKSE